MLLKRLQKTLYKKKNPVQCHLKNIWSLFGDFCFRPGIFLIISDCCKCRANITQISPTLHKKNPALALNKKARLYGTVSTAPCIWRGFLLFQNFNCSLKQLIGSTYVLLNFQCWIYSHTLFSIYVVCKMRKSSDIRKEKKDKRTLHCGR